MALNTEGLTIKDEIDLEVSTNDMHHNLHFSGLTVSARFQYLQRMNAA